MNLNNLQKEFSKVANPAKAKQEKAYMKGQFEYFGIGSKVRRDIQKEFLANNGLPDYSELENIVKDCWERPEREFQYFGLELLFKYKKEYQKDLVELLEFMITKKSWWDTVDIIAVKLVGELFKIYPELILPYTSKWINSSNMWLQRSAILFQLGYKEKTDKELLADLIIKANESKNKDEFFIRKAIGWALRQYSKTNPEWVIEFIKQHDELSNLSKSQGLKWLKDQDII